MLRLLLAQAYTCVSCASVFVLLQPWFSVLSGWVDWTDVFIMFEQRVQSFPNSRHLRHHDLGLTPTPKHYNCRASRQGVPTVYVTLVCPSLPLLTQPS